MGPARTTYARLPNPDSINTRTSTGIDALSGARAIKRLVIGFFIACLLLGALYASKDRISALPGFSNGGQTVIYEVVSAEEEDVVDSMVVNATIPEGVAKLSNFNERSCKSQRQAYRKFVDERSRSQLQSQQLTINPNGTIDGLPYTVAQSHHLTSETCWRAQARYAPVQHEIDDAGNKCNAIAKPKKRTAVVLRLEPTNIFTEDAILNLRALILEVSWYHGYDVILLQNIQGDYDEEKIPAEFRSYLFNYRNDDIFNDYPDQTRAKSKNSRIKLSYEGDDAYRYTTTFFHFAQIWFFKNRPHYSFAYFIESHVRHTSSYSELFTLINEKVHPSSAAASASASESSPDLVTLDPIHVTRPSILWDEADSASPESFYRSRFIIHGVSRRLVEAMELTLRTGLNAPHDAFLIAVAVREGFPVAMLAHPVMKRTDGLLFETYTTPADRVADWSILGLRDDWVATHNVTWQHGGSFAAQTVKWVDDGVQSAWLDEMYQTWKNSARMCLPGLLIYPVSGR